MNSVVQAMRTAAAMCLLAAAAGAELTAEVRDHLGSPALFVNGAPRTPMMFFGWDRGPGPTVTHLSTDWREHHVTFTAPEDNAGNCGVHLRFGNAPGTVWIDDVRFYEGEYREDAAGNRLQCGDWEGERAAVDDAWKLFVKTEAGAEASWAFDTAVKHGGAQSCRLTVAKAGADVMHVHFYQTGLSIETGKTYTFSAWVRADAERTGDMMVLHQGPPWTIYSGAPDSWLHKQVKMAAAEGVHIHSFGIVMPWPKPGDAPDFSATDAVLERVIDADPEALLLPRFGCDPPGWWYAAHPDEALQYDDGSREPVCVASMVWREEMLRNLRALVEHCEARYGEHMLGYHPCAQHTGEWFYPKTWDGLHCGFSPAMQRGFSAWLRKKYATEDALCAAWGDAAVRFDSVAVPAVEERVTASAGLFRDPARERKTIDFYEYLQVAMVEPLELIAATVKDASARKKLVTLFYGYYFEISGLPFGPQTSGHLALAMPYLLLASVLLGSLAMPNGYLRSPEAVNANLADLVRLQAFDLAGERYRPGDTVSVTLYWIALDGLAEDYKAFVHLTDTGLTRQPAQHDGDPGGGYTPTTRWVPGELVPDRHALPLPDDLPPGRYQVWAGMYAFSSGQNLDVVSSDLPHDGRRVLLAEIEVVGP